MLADARSDVYFRAHLSGQNLSRVSCSPSWKYPCGASSHHDFCRGAERLQHRVRSLHGVGYAGGSCFYIHLILTLKSLGAFDMVCEFLPHVAIILYRVYPDSHHFLANLFRVACLTTFIGTISETIVTMYLFGQLWHRWDLSFKIATPILHIAFSAAQFHGTRIFYAMWKKQERLIRDGGDLEKSRGLARSGDSQNCHVPAVDA